MPPNSLRDSKATAVQARRRATAQEPATGLIGDYLAATQLAIRSQQQRKQTMASKRSPGPTIKLKSNGKPMVRTTK